VGTFKNAESATAEGKHFGHERQRIELSACIQRLQDFLLVPDFDQIASLQMTARFQELALSGAHAV
jgi:hypothetical protein